MFFVPEFARRLTTAYGYRSDLSASRRSVMERTRTIGICVKIDGCGARRDQVAVLIFPGRGIADPVSGTGVTGIRDRDLGHRTSAERDVLGGRNAETGCLRVRQRKIHCFGR